MLNMILIKIVPSFIFTYLLFSSILYLQQQKHLYNHKNLNELWINHLNYFMLIFLFSLYIRKN